MKFIYKVTYFITYKGNSRNTASKLEALKQERWILLFLYRKINMHSLPSQFSHFEEDILKSNENRLNDDRGVPPTNYKIV